MRIAVIGVGLIGGSIGLATRRCAGGHEEIHITGYDPDPDAISQAIRVGAIDDAAHTVSEAVGDADVVFVAAPVGALPGLVAETLAHCAPDCLVSDVGSTKREIVAAISDPRFIGGHPLAGAETAGAEHAREDLFDGAVWYLSPSAETPQWSTDRLSELIGRIGARVVLTDAATHDRMMARVSHLPHVLANVLVSELVTALVPGPQGQAAIGAGPSFRDATRVAGANTAIWTDIYLTNRDALIEAIDEAIERLGQVRAALAEADAEALREWNDRARIHRDALMHAGLAPGS